jgi:nucleoside-diphosphate-sugar epimerase
MPTVVVTGVAGSLGQRVAALLCARSDVDRVIGVDVVPSSLSDPKLEQRTIDLAAPSGPGDVELIQAMDRAAGVIHLAWRTSDARGSLPGDDAEAVEVNRRALRRVLDAASTTKPESLVHLSSATVYGAWADNTIPLTEDARLRPNPEFSFAVSKAESERVVTEWAEAHPETHVAILRPAVTVGSEDRPLYQALGITRSPRSGDGGRPVQYLHVDDLAAAVVVAWQKRLSGVFNVAADSGIREDDARALAGGLARLTLPSRVAKTVSAWGWQLFRQGIPVEARAYATHPWVIAPDRLKAAGWAPQYTSEEALVATDARVHWDDLPPGRRQNYNLIIALIAAAAALAGVSSVVAALRARRRRGGAQARPGS